MPKRSNASAVLGLVMLSALAVTAVHAQDYPTKPVKWVVAYPPGGTTDILARIVGQYLSEHLGQPFVIDNRPGAGNNIGTEVVADSPPTATRSCWSIPPTASKRRCIRSCPSTSYATSRPSSASRGCRT
jgi:tripartite-type tricarboxylate transporter receptor subunit TctC